MSGNSPRITDNHFSGNCSLFHPEFGYQVPYLQNVTSLFSHSWLDQGGPWLELYQQEFSPPELNWDYRIIFLMCLSLYHVNFRATSRTGVLSHVLGCAEFLSEGRKKETDSCLPKSRDKDGEWTPPGLTLTFYFQVLVLPGPPVCPCFWVLRDFLFVAKPSL